MRISLRKLSYQGSNSWMMLSNRMTANSLEEKPASHARARTVNTIRLLAPAGLRSGAFIWSAGPAVPGAAIMLQH